MKESALFFTHATATSHVELTSCLLSFVFVLKTQQQVKSTQFKAKTWWRLESVGHSYRWSPPFAGKEQRLSVLLFSIFFRFTFFFNRNKFESFVRCFGRFNTQSPPHFHTSGHRLGKKRRPWKRIAAHKISINPMELNLIILSPL